MLFWKRTSNAKGFGLCEKHKEKLIMHCQQQRTKGNESMMNEDAAKHIQEKLLEGCD